MMRDDLILLHPKLYKKSSVIYNPVAEHILNYGKKFDLTKIKKKNYILCVGRLEKEKAFDFAIESFAQISDRFPDLRLKIVGEGSLKQELKKKNYSFWYCW
jgi:glycosyltransferase involved in cell wall biosynthesis